MHVLIVGANGNIGRRLIKRMASGPHKSLTMIRGLRCTIARPGTLTDEAGTGNVEIAKDLGRHGSVPPDDLATVLLGASSVSHAIAAT